MTVLEKIKRCVSLVWDFQEFYGEEDIEEFCCNELHTYPQHDEIMEYFKHIEELEKENAELKKKNLDTQDAVTMQMYTNKANKEIADRQLTKAKEIIKELIKYDIPTLDYEKAEQFLKEIEKCQSQKQH